MPENVITPEVTQEQVTPEVVQEVKQPETINDIVQEPKEVPKETVGLDKYMSEKKARQAAEKKIADLETAIKNGATQQEISSDIESIGNEYGVDKDFLAKLTKSIKSELGSEFDSKLKPITEEKEKAKFEATFSQKLNDALENMPEYKNVVNPEVLKQLVLVRDNSGKLINGNISMEQLIENTYVNAVGGKRTIEKTSPTGRQDPLEIDAQRMNTDTAYYKEVMSNPILKAKYNAGSADRLSKYL
jgi:hypothetical protein